MQIPTLDFSSYDSQNLESISRLGGQLVEALGEIGFAKVQNIGISQQDLALVFAQASEFFAQPEPYKSHYVYRSAAENFGYQGVKQEFLDPGKPADLKETFTMRNIVNRPLGDERWPGKAFAKTMRAFYQKNMRSAEKLQQALALSLQQSMDFFTNAHSGENATLRLLHYPAIDKVETGQLGAGEHTDYGMLTLLYQRQIPGLEVLDNSGQWMTVESEENTILINSGDLLERWTNGKLRSTLHRVQPMGSGVERYSIAMFVDPDSNTPINPLPSCIDDAHPQRYGSLTAGEHLQEKLQASHKDLFKP